MQNFEKFMLDSEHTETVARESDSKNEPTTSPSKGRRVTKDGIILVPQPTEDPQDPLNWTLSYKVVLLLIVSLAAYAGTQVAVANASGLVAQAVVYHKTPLQISYSLSAGIAGNAFGPLLWLPISYKIGRTAAIFWGMILAMTCTIWSAEMTGSNDYIPFVLSRLFASLFGSVGNAIGSSCVLDIFFLHQRGRAFTIYGLLNIAGTTMAPTFSGFIVDSTTWPVQFWYCVAVQGLVAIAALAFMKETGYTRLGGDNYPKPPSSYVRNRLATILGSKSVIPAKTWKEVAQKSFSQIQIGLKPVTLVVGLFQLTAFGWVVGIQTLLTIYLLTPVAAGGYGFTVKQNAYFTFNAWVAVLTSLTYGSIVSDRLPLYLCKRWGAGVWKPEYRLYSLWGSTFIWTPIGLGLFGAALQYQLHYMVLALGSYLAIFGTSASAPPTMNYLVECFTTHSVEVTGILNTFRLSFGISIPFFIDPLIESVGGPGWAYGLMALVSLVPYALMVFLMWKGPMIRKWSTGTLNSTEEGVKVEVVDAESK